MPSFRRTVSDSATSARANPYPTSLSLSAAGAVNAGFPIRPRRSGSETSNRRVLADIEWWRILDGQHAEGENNESSHDQNENQNVNPRDNTNIGQDVTNNTNNINTEMPSTALATAFDEENVVSNTSSDLVASRRVSTLTNPFSTLSLSPVPPSTPPRYRRASSDSDSSAESTPESSPHSSPRTPALRRGTLFDDSGLELGLEIGARLGGLDLGCTSLEEDEFCATLPFLGSRSGAAATMSAMSMSIMRSLSFRGFASSRESAEDERFGDVIFL